jgi:hypothetical protein
VAVKQIALKSVPGKLSNIRQKEISILKVTGLAVAVISCFVVHRLINSVGSAGGLSL